METLPYSLKVLLENLARRADGSSITDDDVAALAGWDPARPEQREVSFTPARILLQDFTGVPAVVDLAAVREAVESLGGIAATSNPSVMIAAGLVVKRAVERIHRSNLIGMGVLPLQLADGTTFDALARFDTPMEAAYFRHGGILRYVVRQVAATDRAGR